MQELTIDYRWTLLKQKLHLEQIEGYLSLEALLMMVGLQEVQTIKSSFSKEEKKDLIHIGTCTVLSQSGFYTKLYTDEEGWPHFQKKTELPAMDLKAQELFLKDHVLLYFQQHLNQL